MKIAKLISLLSVMILTAALAQAQIAVDPANDSCWDSLSSVRACQQVEVQRAAAQAQQCTSFPEYQCTPEQSVARPRVETKNSKKQDVKGAVNGLHAHAGSNAALVDYAPVQR
jgi:hypothetical protein